MSADRAQADRLVFAEPPGPALTAQREDRGHLAGVVGFRAYAIVVFALTHWPRLTLPETGLERTDLYVHLLVFALWTVLLNLTGYLGPVLSPRANGLRAAIATAYVCFDEATQAIPFIHRDARWDDLAANLTGVLAGTIGVLAWGFATRSRSRRP